MTGRPGRSHKGFGINDVLVDHTLIARAGLLMEEAERLDWQYLVDLFALIEAVVLHDRLLILPAGLSRDERDLPLRRVLDREGILCAYSPRSQPRDVALRATQLAAFGKDASQLELEQLRAAFATAVGHIYGEGPAETVAISPSVEYLLRPSTSMMPSNQYPFAREGYGVLHYLMRTYVYCAVSQLESLSQYPDVERIPILGALEHRLTTLLTDRAYARLATCLDATVKELSRWGGPFSVTVPPAPALAPSKCSCFRELCDAVLEVRREFHDFRQTFAAYQRRMAQASTLADADKSAKELRRVLKTLSDTYGEAERGFVLEALDWVRAIARLVLEPLKPDSYSSEVYERPLEWLRSWWLRRRLIHLFDLTSRVQRIPHYGRLVERVFGRSLLPVEEARLQEYAKALHTEIVGREGRIKR